MSLPVVPLEAYERIDDGSLRGGQIWQGKRISKSVKSTGFVVPVLTKTITNILILKRRGLADIGAYRWSKSEEIHGLLYLPFEIKIYVTGYLGNVVYIKFLILILYKA